MAVILGQQAHALNSSLARQSNHLHDIFKVDVVIAFDESHSFRAGS